MHVLSSTYVVANRKDTILLWEAILLETKLFWGRFLHKKAPKYAVVPLHVRKKAL